MFRHRPVRGLRRRLQDTSEREVDESSPRVAAAPAQEHRAGLEQSSRLLSERANREREFIVTPEFTATLHCFL